MKQTYKVVVDNNGDTYWYNEKDQLHRDNGLPAIELADGSKQWYDDGKLHRNGGLPAIEWADGSREWYVNDQRYRDGGLPAVELADGTKEWWVNGQLETEEQAKQPTTTCEDNVVTINGKKYKLIEV